MGPDRGTPGNSSSLNQRDHWVSMSVFRSELDLLLPSENETVVFQTTELTPTQRSKSLPGKEGGLGAGRYCLEYL